MPSRSVVVQLRNGVGNAVLPDHRKMVPGKQYVIDWEAFEKISVGARQNVIEVVNVISDTDTAGFYPAQTQSGSNIYVDFLNELTKVSANATDFDNLAGFSAQGTDGRSNVGVAPVVFTTNGSYPANQGGNALTGPAGERYVLVYIPYGVTIDAGDALAWIDSEYKIATPDRPTYNVATDGQGTEYVVPVTSTYTDPVNIGTTQGGFAGVAITTIASNTTGLYTYIQTEGFCPLVNVFGPVNVGDTLKIKDYNHDAQPTDAGDLGNSALATNSFGTALTGSTDEGSTTVQAELRSVTKVKKPYQRFLNKN